MVSQHERRFQPNTLSNAPPAFSGKFENRVQMTRVNARAPMNRSEQRAALLIWVCSVCAVLLALSEVIKLLYRASKALAGG